jgi:hypothetical protein
VRLDCRPVGLGHSPSASAIGGLEQPSSAAVNTAQRPAHRLNCLGQPERSLPACRRGARGGLARCALRRRHHRIHRRPASMATQASANWPRAQSWPPTARGDVALARGGPLGSRGRAGRLPPPPPCCCVDLGPRAATKEADSAAFGHPGLLFDDAFMRRLGRKLASLPRLRAVATLRPFPPDACAWLAAAGFEELHPLATSEPTSPGRHLSGGEGGEGEGGGGRGGGGEAGSGEEHEHEHELACTWGPARVHVYVRPPPDPFPIGC